MSDRATNSLNPNHERRLAVTCRHIDKLLSEMENALNVSASKQAFPEYASAQVERLIGDRTSPGEQEGTIRRDLERLERTRPEQPVAS